jgi:hypothetical protein
MAKQMGLEDEQNFLNFHSVYDEDAPPAYEDVDDAEADIARATGIHIERI